MEGELWSQGDRSQCKEGGPSSLRSLELALFVNFYDVHILKHVAMSQIWYINKHYKFKN